jgi:hypothetical protein
MKSLFCGVVGAVALASLGSDASAGLTDEARSLPSATAGTVHGGMTLAKAKKKRRPAGGGGAKTEAADDDAADEAPASKSASASSDSSDDAKEEEIFGSKKKAPPKDDGESSGGGAAAPKPRPKMVDETVESKASEEESGSTSSLSALEFGVGLKALFRNFGWTSDGRAAGLGPYSLSPGPETGLWLDFYPAAFGTSGFASNVGIFGHFNYGFGVATTLANGDVVSTTFRDFLGGVKVRIPFGTFIPNASIGYGQQIFAVAPQMTPQDLPQLAYQFVRPALGARIMFAPTVALDLSAGYLLVMNPGSGANYVRAANFFPKATSYGFDITASVAFRLTGSIGLRGGADLRSYVIANHPDSTTRSVAGAVDRYISVWAGVEVVLDSQGAAAGGDDDSEPAKPSKRKRRRAAEPKEDDESESESESESE